jgi:murein DD-endopeptidase MepM/ murein hydrolase activator NlpD
MFGFVSSYARMVWKVADYNSLRDQITSIRSRYERLQSESNQTREQLAALQLFASEVSLAYGIKNKLEGPPDIAREGRLVPTFRESLAEYNTLKSANFSHFYRTYARRWQTNVMPSIWPLEGRLLSSYGNREDPFRGLQAFHAGVDISAEMGTAVRSAGDGIVVFAEFNGAYGRLVIVDHGGGIETYYAHLSRFDVIAGQEVRRGQVIAHSGASGRVTSPHLHYEVRHGGNPVNPYRYLARSTVAQNVKKDFPF